MIVIEIPSLSNYAFFRVHPCLKDGDTLSQLMYLQDLDGCCCLYLFNLHLLLPLYCTISACSHMCISSLQETRGNVKFETKKNLNVLTPNN